MMADSLILRWAQLDHEEGVCDVFQSCVNRRSRAHWARACTRASEEQHISACDRKSRKYPGRSTRRSYYGQYQSRAVPPDINDSNLHDEPRSMELYNLLGVWPDIQHRAKVPPLMRVYKLPGGVEPVVTFAMDPHVDPTPSTPFMNFCMFGQDHVQEILVDHLVRHGCDVEFGTELCSFEQNLDTVTAHVLHRRGDEEINEHITCRWLMGTDGARGIVRKQLGLSFPGVTLPLSRHLIIGDIEVKGLDHIPKAVAEPDELLRVLRAGTGRDDIDLGVIRWISEYRPNERMVDTLRKGRVFVAGDAGHVHSPFGGQGLNSSIQDANNVAWKLVLVEKGLALPSLLDTYTEERLPVIAQMLKTSSELFDETIAAKRDGKTSEKAWYRGGYLHQLGVNYRWSSIVVDERAPPESAPVDPYGVHRQATDIVRAGERAPDAPDLLILGMDGATEEQTTSLFRIYSPSCHTVLLFDGTFSEDAPLLHTLHNLPPSMVRTVLILPEKSPGLPGRRPDGIDSVLLDQHGHAYRSYFVARDTPTIVIVRPDGAVGGIVFGLDGLTQYFRGVFSAATIM